MLASLWHWRGYAIRSHQARRPLGCESMSSPRPSPALPARQLPCSAVLPAPRFRYSPVVVVGGFAFVSGMVGLDPGTGALAEGGAYGQSRQILANLRALCAEQGWSLGQIVVARLYCADFSRFDEVNRAWEACFADIEPPARTSVGVSALPLSAAVEMEFQFVVG
jgi:2-iminobutanoate/2-iminopropanoate deaminase